MCEKKFFSPKSKIKKNVLFLFFTIFFLIFSRNPLQAIEIKVSPVSARVNEKVNIEIVVTFSAPVFAPVKPSCSIEINFGDGSGWIEAGTCTDVNCLLSIAHTYKVPGIYTITVRSKRGFCFVQPSSPDPATASITIECESLTIISPSTLPPVPSGKPFKFEIQTSGGQPPIIYSLLSGSLPQGLNIDTKGIISGTPTAPGDYSFTIRASDSCPVRTQINQKTFSLKVNPPPFPPLNIKQLQIYFENKKQEITVKRKEPDLKAFAEINFEGSGFLQGYWEVDGRVLSFVNKFVSLEGKIIITTPDLPALPTLEPGTHKLRFVIKSPLQEAKPPEIKYFVTAEEFQEVTRVEEHPHHVPGQILLLTEEIEKGEEFIEEIRKKFNLVLIDSYRIKSLQIILVIFCTDENIFKVIEMLKKEKGVISAQPNYIFRTMEEPMADMQNVQKILNLKKLHEYCKGKGVKVAVIDTGVDTKHEDLKERILYSENFIKDSLYKAEIHGTAVAGVIGASINGYGIEGIAPECEILALRACRQVSEENPEGECYTSSIAKAIDFAIENNANLVNMSFGSVAKDELISKLIREGSNRKIIFVAPIGNIPSAKNISFPASHPEVISVGGIDESGELYPNPEIASKADVLAPSKNIFTTIPGNKHNFLSGTSISSAIVSGILALAVERNGSLKKKNFPSFKGDICKWQEELLKISLCKK